MAFQWIATVAVAAMAAQAPVQNPVWTPADRTTGAAYTCATLFDPSSNAPIVGNWEAQEWIFGFFSGLNLGQNAMIGAGSDSNGILGEVRLYCQSHPSMQLIEATLNTWMKLRAATAKQ